MAEDISKKIIIQVEAETDDLKKSLTELNQTLDGLLQRQKQIADIGKDNTKTFKDYAAQVKQTQSAIEAHTKAIGDNDKQLIVSKSSLQNNKAQLESLKKQYDKLTAVQGDHAKGTARLNTQIGTLSNTIAEQEKKLADSRKVFDLHKGTTDALKSSFDKLKNVSGDFGPSLKEAAEGFDSLKTGLSVVKTGFTSVGQALKTTGFGLLVLVLQSVVDYLTKTKKGSAQLKGAISAIGKVIEIVKKTVDNFKKVIIEAFTHPVESLKTLGNIIWENIINRFKAAGVILDGIIHLDFKKMADGVLQSATGITYATDKISNTFKALKSNAIEAFKEVKNAYDNGAKHADKAAGKMRAASKTRQAERKQEVQQQQTDDGKSAQKDVEDKKAALAENLKAAMDNYAKELSETDEYYRQLSEQYKSFLEEYNTMTDAQKLQHRAAYKTATAGIIQLEKDRAKERLQITEKFNADNEKILQGKDIDSNPDAALQNGRKKAIDDVNAYDLQKAKETDDKKNELTKKAEQDRKDFAIKTAQGIAVAAFGLIRNSIKTQSEAKIKGLETDKAKELSNSSLTSAQKFAIEEKYKQKENQVKIKAFKDEQKASIGQAVINGAIAVTKAESQTGVLGEFVIPLIIAQTAIQVATIASQKPPQYAKGGLHYASDGKGALLPGYSRTDNTNAYLRSGEAVVVSEAMRDPWARNLVSAINVAYGGRDFAATNPTRGYAIGGIFTDGGNSNRYYNQPVHDQKDLANTLAYQMINNFPPIYVDVKDVNNQQNILAQTTNRVNL